MIRQLTHEECMSLLAGIRQSQPGDWTHDLYIIHVGPARFVERLLLPDGQEFVYFRTEDGAGAWPGPNWDRFAVPRVIKPTVVEQLTLF